MNPSVASHCSNCVLAARKACTPDAAGAGQISRFASLGNKLGLQRSLVYVSTAVDNSLRCVFHL